MRPVLLEMAGFAAFREPTTVDFTGIDHFALVGPTGSGKSTVIDAMTFALYGSVRRWDNQRTVALALAPTAGRGVVRLVFDLAGQRYVVARELRRAASGSVAVRNARLERLADPTGVGALDEETEPLADGSAATTDAVTELLGLPFGDFCTCVVLPQGEFAEFLHTEPRKRQEKLVRILGLGVYEQIAKAANTEANEQKLRAGVLSEQLTGYADATELAEQAAAARAGELAALAARVAAAVPELAASVAGRAQAVAQTERMRTEQRLFAGLTVPQGVDGLHARQVAAADAGRLAAERLLAAEQTDGAARAALAAAPSRDRLDQLRRDHAELAAGRADLPGLQERAEKALAGFELATQYTHEAQLALDRARVRRERAVTTLISTDDEVRRLVTEQTMLRGVSMPAGLDVLAAQRTAATTALDAAQAALAVAESADSAARAAQAEAPARAPLERARHDLAALLDNRARWRIAAERITRADAELRAAGEAATATEHQLGHARDRLAEQQRSELAASLRPALVVGDGCPVCAAPVTELPEPLPAADLATAQRALAAAEREHGRARERVLAAELTCAELARQRGELVESARPLWSGVVSGVGELLAEQMPDARGGAPEDAAVRKLGAAVDVQLGVLDQLAGRVAECDAAVRTARVNRAGATSAAAEAAEGLRAAETALRSARDRLVPLGGAGADTDGPLDVLAGWTALLAWAGGAAEDRDERLAAARDIAGIARVERDAAEAAVRTAERAARDRRSEETAAARAEQEARDTAAVLQRRTEQLAQALVAVPDADQVARELAGRAELESAAATAEAQLRAAREAQRGADRIAADLGRETSAGWQVLRAARDPLVGLGAPELPSEELRTAWTVLHGWATERAAAGLVELSAAEAAAQHAQLAMDEVERRVGAELAAHSVPVTGALAETALPAAVTAAERANGERRRIADRRAAAAALVADRDAADSAHQVAKMLGGLLRSDGFPRWLVASALDALVADASASLLELSGGQFELTHAGGEFLVIDHADADARRPVKTLSGGETFQASLALALALSGQLSALAAHGAGRIESIFIDEGFGTLDEANLDVVASTLENLAAHGDRMVGVITHVPALAERVPVRFVVSRDERTATVIREDR